MSADFDVINYIDPFIGTGFHGHTFPGPVMPHGMIQLGPDTKLNGWDASSGYHYGDGEKRLLVTKIAGRCRLGIF